jgi:membrane associated rhomboid family serine protease
MTPAPVGFQCPECVREGAASVSQVRTPFGGRVSTTPYVTFTIIGLCITVYAIELLAGQNKFISDFGNAPAAIAINNEYYRLVTSMFLHASILHILFNMYILYVFGPTLERLLGHVRFATLYLLAGLGGSVASFWFSLPIGVSVGASGAIFGLMGAMVVVGSKMKINITQVVALIAINLVLGFAIPNVDWRAHIGGLITGAAVAALYVYVPRGPRRTTIHVLGSVAVFAVLIGLTLVHEDTVTSEVVRLISG